MSKAKKVLLTSYYWPPAGGAGVQRWLKMSKVIAEQVELSVYHPKNADYPISDPSLNKEVPEQIKSISLPIREPYALAKKINPKNKNYQKGMIEDESKQSLLSKISLWVRANLFIPDARSGWIQPSYKFLKNYLQENPQDVIISTGPPHSMHMIALKLKNTFPDIKWIADFRDPWTAIDYFDKLPLQSWALKKHQSQEKQVLLKADAVTTVSPTWAKDLGKLGNRKVEVIYNGFDKEDFVEKHHPSDDFVLTYIGSLNADRNPKNLWTALNQLCENQEFYNDFRLRLIGSIAPEVRENIAEHPLLESKTEYVAYLEHQKAVEALQESQVLLLLINQTANENGIIPGKFFEYLAAERVIMCIGKKDSDIAQLLNDLSAGVVINRDDKEEMLSVLRILFHEYQNHLLNRNKKFNISTYSRKNAAFQFLKLIDNL
ncbi:glycosyltransferase [Weeksellaceae bacterium KMM 9724]|uniref:glycosyltransferase n=1 Tax=Profundicola chukchiensis TaxID=2961959 RepID=UPI00243CEB46|nr:glycosyltransferase [Profundicola chukchiensis]MDG4949711.1 glycosyltransferase [Profundicola chukchiensis]